MDYKYVKEEERQRNVARIASNLAQVPTTYLSKLGVTVLVYCSTGWVVHDTVNIVLHSSCRDSIYEEMESKA